MSARVAVEYIPPLHFMPTCPTVVVLSSTYRTMRRERDRTLTKILARKKKSGQHSTRMYSLGIFYRQIMYI